MKTSTFREKLDFGNDGELFFKNLLLHYGCSIVPTYDYKTAQGQAPRMYYADGHVVIPDLDCTGPSGRFWVECKRYNTSPFNRSLQANVHGVKKRLYRDYMTVQELSRTPVWLFVLEHSIQHKNGSVDIRDRVLACQLDVVPIHPCQCRSCANGLGRCHAPVPESLYIRRDSFMHVAIPQGLPIPKSTSSLLYNS